MYVCMYLLQSLKVNFYKRERCGNKTMKVTRPFPRIKEYVWRQNKDLLSLQFTIQSVELHHYFQY